MTELSDDILDWADKPGPEKFFATLRQHLERGGKAQHSLDFSKEPLTVDEQIQLSELFGNRIGTVTATKVDLRRVRENLSSRKLSLEDLIGGVLGTVTTWFETSYRRKTRKRIDVAKARMSLLREMEGIPQLEGERYLLLGMPVRPAYQVPKQTKTRAGAWKPYEAAIRAAAVWWGKWDVLQQGRIPERVLLATAFKDSKSERLDGAGRLAFQNLIECQYDEAVEGAETSIRLSGPLVWQISQVVADATIATPWVGVPSRSIRDLGRTDGDPDGLLLIENQETFEQVCRRTAVNQRWLCIWNEGFAALDLIEFIKLYKHLPVAVCCDLDPPGIRIVQNLIKALGFEVHPVGMSVDIWHHAPKLDESLEKRADWKAEASALATTSCPEALRPLAEAIAKSGERVEQEQMILYRDIIQAVPGQLEALRRSARCHE